MPSSLPSFLTKRNARPSVHVQNRSRSHESLNSYWRCFQTSQLIFFVYVLSERFIHVVCHQAFIGSQEVTLVFFAGDLILIFSPILVQTAVLLTSIYKRWPRTTMIRALYSENLGCPYYLNIVVLMGLFR